MSYQPNASQEYLKNAVLTATPEQLQLMLIDGAIRFTSRGKEALANRDYEGMFAAFERAQRIVLEMANGLNREVNPQIVDQMVSLYNYVYRELVDSCMHSNPDAADNALRILRHQRETWELLIDRLKKSSVEESGPAAPSAPGGYGGPSAGSDSESGGGGFVAEG